MFYKVYNKKCINFSFSMLKNNKKFNINEEIIRKKLNILQDNFPINNNYKFSNDFNKNSDIPSLVTTEFQNEDKLFILLIEHKFKKAFTENDFKHIHSIEDITNKLLNIKKINN
jgi:hypothetical protein